MELSQFQNEMNPSPFPGRVSLASSSVNILLAVTLVGTPFHGLVHLFLIELNLIEEMMPLLNFARFKGNTELCLTVSG